MTASVSWGTRLWNGISSLLSTASQPRSQHACIDPKCLFLTGEHITTPLHNGCLNCSVSRLPSMSKKPRIENITVADGTSIIPVIKTQEAVFMPSTVIPSSHLDLGEFVNRSVEEVKAAINLLSTKRGDVQTISIPKNVNVTPEIVSSLKTQFPKLQGLHIDGAHLQNLEMHHAIAQTGTKNVDLSHSKLTDDQLIQFILENPDIENLDITDCGLITDKGFAALSKLTFLKSLKAGLLVNVSKEGLNAIPTENLVYLDLRQSWNFYSNVSDDLCKHLATAKNLRYLNFTGAGGTTTGITDEGIDSLAKNNPLLEALLFQDIYKGTSDGLKVLKNLTNLVELDLSREFSDGPPVNGDVISMFGTMPELAFLRLSNNFNSIDPTIFSTFTNSKIVQLWIDSLFSKSNVLNEGISYLPSTLLDLRISSCSINAPLTETLCASLVKFTDLLRLKLGGYFLNGDVVSKYWEGNLKKLEELNVSYGDAQGFEVVCRNSSNIACVVLYSGNPVKLDYDVIKPLLTLEDFRIFSIDYQLPEQFLLELLALKRPLEYLDLSNCLITPAIIKALPNVASTLKWIWVQYGSDESPGLEHLARLENLQTLNLWGNFKPEDYSFLPLMKNVKNLFITDCYGDPSTIYGKTKIPGGVDDSVVQLIGQMPALRNLTFQLTRFGNDALSGLVPCPLDILAIWYNSVSYPSQINDGAVPILSEMTSLQILETECQLTKQGLQQVNEAVKLFWEN